MHILVAGGAGYIGSITVEHLVNSGYTVTVVDNLSKGHKLAVHPSAQFFPFDLSSTDLLDELFSSQKFDAVMHFCASSLVGESVQDPILYYRNNLSNGLNLLSAMIKHNVKAFVFSSTAAIFGQPVEQPISESAAKQPLNPYGRSKLFFESILSDCDVAHGVKSVCLRYFNAAGATEERGEDHRPESHLIPVILDVARGKREDITVFGDDYDTLDGTCVRDYVHVLDLAQAHKLSVDYLLNGNESNQFNLGNGLGFSVADVIKSVEKVTGKQIKVVYGERRAGDPATLIASSQKIRETLGWKPQFTELDAIIASAWKWHLANPEGYHE